MNDELIQKLFDLAETAIKEKYSKEEQKSLSDSIKKLDAGELNPNDSVFEEIQREYKVGNSNCEIVPIKSHFPNAVIYSVTIRRIESYAVILIHVTDGNIEIKPRQIISSQGNVMSLVS